jgi:hypothetical protein
MARHGAGAVRLLLLFGALSLGAVTVGALVCAQSGIPASLWLRNIAAWVVGAVVAIVIARIGGPRALPFILWAAPLGLAATLLSAGQDGVHRWVNAGPVSLNVAMLLLPMAVVSLAVLAARRWAWLPAFLSLAILAAQPDASQATAFGSAMGLIALTGASGGRTKGVIVLAAAVLIAVAWLRPDPLQPVPEVEQIMDLAFRLTPLLAALAVALLTGACLAPGLAARQGPRDLHIAGLALSACLAAWAIMPYLGHFPVPLVGIGLSPIVGAWLGVGLLAGLMRRG